VLELSACTNIVNEDLGRLGLLCNSNILLRRTKRDAGYTVGAGRREEQADRERRVRRRYRGEKGRGHLLFIAVDEPLPLLYLVVHDQIVASHVGYYRIFHIINILLRDGGERGTRVSGLLRSLGYPQGRL